MNSDWLDRLGGFASATCALHCLALIFIPAAVTLFGMSHASHGVLEWLFFSTAALFAVLAAVAAFRSHGVAWIVGGFAIGLAILTAGRMGEALSLFEGGGYVAVTGGLVLVASHLLSIRQTRIHRAACC